MIHNPTFKPAPIEEVKKKKRVTPPVKKKIEDMAADGASADVIAEDLGLELDQVQKYL
jgi:4-alpha-glucanotransferase